MQGESLPREFEQVKYHFGDSIIAAVEQIDLIQPFPLTHFHHFRAKITERSGCASVLHAREHITVFVHIGHPGNALDAQTVDDDVHMNVAAFVVTVRVRCDQSLVTGEMRFAKLQPCSLTLCTRACPE